jgi:hypothetical protein
MEIMNLWTTNYVKSSESYVIGKHGTQFSASTDAWKERICQLQMCQKLWILCHGQTRKTNLCPSTDDAWKQRIHELQMCQKKLWIQCHRQTWQTINLSVLQQMHGNTWKSCVLHKTVGFKPKITKSCNADDDKQICFVYTTPTWHTLESAGRYAVMRIAETYSATDVR